MFILDKTGPVTIQTDLLGTCKLDNEAVFCTTETHLPPRPKPLLGDPWFYKHIIQTLNTCWWSNLNSFSYPEICPLYITCVGSPLVPGGSLKSLYVTDTKRASPEKYIIILNHYHKNILWNSCLALSLPRYITNMTTPLLNNPCPGRHEIYKFSRPYNGHHY